jgi:hypothetical protein
MYQELKDQLKDDEIDFYEYEKRLDGIMTNFGRDILESSLSDTDVVPSKKKS